MEPDSGGRPTPSGRLPDPDDPAASVSEVGPRPSGGGFPRWVRRAGLPSRMLSPVPLLRCRPISSGSSLAGWRPEEWSPDFVDMATGAAVRRTSRAAVAWDHGYLYVAFEFTDPDREARETRPGSHVYQTDTTAEFFVAGPTGYYEVGVNSAGVGYEVAWQWVAPLVAAGDMEGIDRLFRLPDFLYYAPQDGERVGRVGDLDYRLSGRTQSVSLYPGPHGPAWMIAMALPWDPLLELLGLAGPVAPGLELRAQAMRTDPGGRGGREVAEYSAWSVQGNANVHNLDRWARVVLADQSS